MRLWQLHGYRTVIPASKPVVLATYRRCDPVWLIALLYGANLSGANLSGADLSGAKYSAKTGRHPTIFPANFDPKAAKMVLSADSP
jgi:hypothetical protein